MGATYKSLLRAFSVRTLRTSRTWAACDHERIFQVWVPSQCLPEMRTFELNACFDGKCAHNEGALDCLCGLTGGNAHSKLWKQDTTIFQIKKNEVVKMKIWFDSWAQFWSCAREYFLIPNVLSYISVRSFHPIWSDTKNPLLIGGNVQKKQIIGAWCFDSESTFLKGKFRKPLLNCLLAHERLVKASLPVKVAGVLSSLELSGEAERVEGWIWHKRRTTKTG